ncbi:MAG: tyrosine recombinase XerC [Holosporales bacterium]|jgi:integrase/recombinase XerC|nr:tyrosine recombinase XerC [Holosporales bacterium]
MTLPPTQAIFSAWVAWMQEEKQYAANTVSAYIKDGRSFIDFFVHYQGGEQEISWEALTPQDIRAWLAHRLQAGGCARSNARALSALRTFYGFLRKRFQVTTNVFLLIRKPKTPKLLPHPLEHQVLEMLLSEEIGLAHEPPWMLKRDRALYVFLYATGVRISEALGVTGKILQASGTISLVGKGNKERLVPLLPMVLQKMREYAEACPYALEPDKAFFLNLHGRPLGASHVRGRLHRLRTSFGLPSYTTPHAFRHSFATHLLAEGADLRTVQELLGHASLASTQIYVDVADQKILEVYRKAHPLEKPSRGE